MADLTDVENALVTLISGTVYPNGTAQPSVAAAPVKVYAGWPASASLDADLVAGTANITVFPRPEERNTTRFPKDWIPGTLETKTFTLTQTGQTISFGGAQPSPYYQHNFAAFIDGIPYTVQAGSNDTPQTLATALQALIVAAVAGTTVTGATITLPNTARIGALRVGTQAKATREVRRQEKRFQISIWAPTPAIRTALASALDAALADVPRLSLSDGSGARLLYRSSAEVDALQKAKLYRRDFFYTVEYGTTQSMIAPEAIVFTSDFYNQDSSGAAIASTLQVIQA